MPELPEVETVGRGLASDLLGKTVVRVAVHRTDLRRAVPEDLGRLEGVRLTGVRRIAKYLILSFDGAPSVLVHLGMSGRFLLKPPGAEARQLAKFYADGAQARADHVHVALEMDDGTCALYQDPRRFGLMIWGDETHALLAHLGPDPTGNAFSGPVLAAALKGKKTPIKAALLNQKLVCGVGNIYACEALWRAGLSPRRSAHTVQGGRAEKLAEAIRTVLAEAIDAGGSSLRDYVHTDGELGYFQHRFSVYDREGALCPRCETTPVRRIVQSNRSSFYCPTCQK